MNKKDLKINSRYNWINQPERLIYLGYVNEGGWWHQFALVEKPEQVWSEVTDNELRFIEETK